MGPQSEVVARVDIAGEFVDETVREVNDLLAVFANEVLVPVLGEVIHRAAVTECT